MKYCDATCKPCIYSTVLSNWPWACAYILTTGERRGCPPGEGCTRRKEGEKQPTIDSIVFHGNNKKKPAAYYSEQKRQLVQRTRAKLQGRQRAVIEAYMSEHGLSTSQFALLVGVSERTMRQWKNEGNQADWKKLAQLGIEKPEIE